MTFVFCFVTMGTVVAADSKQRIYDDANLLSEAEVTKLEELAQEYSDKQETDFIIVTTDDVPEGEIEDYMLGFYHNEQLGYDQPRGNVAMLMVGMLDDDVMLIGFEKAYQYLDNKRVDQVLDKITPSLSNKDYYNTFEGFIETSSEYMEFRPGVNPENPLFKWWVQLGASLVVAGLVVGTMVYNSGGKVTTNSRTYFDDNNSRINSKRDIYVNKTVSKRRKPSNNNKSGGGRGGGGGVTRGGRSFSSGRRKF